MSAEPAFEEHSNGGVVRALKDCLAGTCGGIAQVLVGQPFDTVKVRLQTQPRTGGLYTGAIDCVQKTFKAEGFGGFYKGTATPLVGVGLCVSVQFAVFEHMKRVFRERNGGEGLSGGQFYIAGAAAGIANSALACPIEHVRIRLQTQTATNALYNGPIDCIKKIYSSYGIRGIFKGYGPTFIREGHGMGAYFLAYEALVNSDMSKNSITRDQIPAYRLCLYGAGAGYAMWFTSYPIDVIKSRLQTDGFAGEAKKYLSGRDCLRKTWKGEGMGGFWRGFGPTVVRAAPVNAATFLVFEAAMRAMN
ncbi:mitochondrial carrier [Saitoella complicata NRRL Y-17804]|uniref:mitochondrial carrier n=1 Tax=Saitoella complicata (strain BCRC 22490 / CBS 7301 / JCM 7358 / NBRC 10748 / NRRL Y-17804) TaxID=698492 RepID=UPI000867CB20|nr:mitochondrial carrier [Saitoella complicata NRRL Y-17804]ODQ52188.1 mitochondrial carrier [Saitoella complicata NRRL Y-17804]